MTLEAGRRLGAYEILAPLGAGGMGEVYRARDSKLQREVAIKVLPELFASDRERRERFEREAQLLAAFNHPHIAQVYGLETAAADDGRETHAIIMELVEGEDLAQRPEDPLQERGGLSAARSVERRKGVICRFHQQRAAG